jgi:hypothetical protein
MSLLFAKICMKIEDFNSTNNQNHLVMHVAVLAKTSSPVHLEAVENAFIPFVYTLHSFSNFSEFYLYTMT